ncbi:hypothetical protein GPECTOR_17g792 [Gonium pectorale]|uniref:Protein kinase domain-containing protein n=1 Tax=Gonium pectorale TaxID=33097 RepID=A0A150GK08_GONPE|nr:hypothetical protein GPECTOR_17g792 [Gonium pectorale]|eukprot:KXZ50156.1 hypothetical protein GPECTOR_17g792 [Gonium pectorale]
MQMVYKWLHASDLTAAPDPRLEVPVEPEASQSSPHRGADGTSDRTSAQRVSTEAGGAGRQGAVERAANASGGWRLPGGTTAPGAPAAGQNGGVQGSAAPRGGQAGPPAYVFRSARGPPLLTADEIAALEAVASDRVNALRGLPAQAQQGSKAQAPKQEPLVQAAEPLAEAQTPAPADAPIVVGGAIASAAPNGGDGHSASAEAQQRPSQSQDAYRLLKGGEIATGPGHHTQGQPPDGLLQHSLSDLYVSGQAGMGANLPPRVLAGSDDTFNASERLPSVLEVPPQAGTTAATPAATGGAGAPVAARELGDSSARSGGAAGGAAAAVPRHGSSTAPPARTKTIAVASHCPMELQPQPPSASWTIDDFTLLKKLYEGSLSVVCQAQHKRSKRHVALKIYKRSRLHEMERFQLAREICLHIRIVHPHVVALYAAWKDSKYVYLALEWAPQGNMFDFLVSRGGRLGEEEAARVVMKPLFSALAFLHSQHFIHRDVKLENLLLDASCTLKLADFGLAIDQKFEQANTRLGTFGYFAPEVLDCPLKKGPFDLKDASVPGYDSRVDVWSAGVVGYEVLTGRAPFSASSPAKIIQAIRTRALEFPNISDEGKDFLRSALTRDPSARPTARQLLSHPWILRHCRGSISVSGALSAALAAPIPLALPEEESPPVVQESSMGHELTEPDGTH